MNALAAIRPDEWDLALFVHLLGAFTLVGALVVAASFLFTARRDGSVELTRVGFRTLLMVAFPSYLATRFGGEWIASKENLEDSDATWLTIGYISTDAGFVVLLAATIASGLVLRRAGRGEEPGSGAGLASWLLIGLVAAYAVVIWTMATKPA